MTVPPPEAAAHYLPLAGATVYCLDTGGEGQPVLLLHPNTGTSESWAFQISALASHGFRVIAFDRRGCGRSICEVPSGDVPPCADDIEAIADILGLQSYFVIGAAAGAFVAIDLASCRPSRLRGVVFAMSNGGFSEPEIETAFERIKPPYDTIRDKMIAELSPDYRARSPEGAVRWLEILENRNSRARGWPKLLRSPNTFSKLARIEVPTLVIAGGADMLSPPSLMRMWVKYVRNAQFKVIHDAGHCAHWERPADFNEIVLTFLRG